MGRYEGNRGNWDRYQRLLAVKIAWKRSKRERRRELLGLGGSDACKKTLRLHRNSINLTRSAQRHEAREHFNADVKFGPGPGGIENVLD